MDFAKLLQDTDCNCLEKTIQDNENLYARKINTPNPVLDRDFKSYWQKGRRADECKEICGLKGLSANSWDENDKNAIIKKYLKTFTITPRHKDCIFVFRLLPNSGLIEHTPNKKDPTHYDFYKSDNFTLDMLESHSIIPLKDFIDNE